jgi:hypothetical protein
VAIVQPKKTPFISVTWGIRGFFAVLLGWNARAQIWEPLQTGIGSYKTKEDAWKEAHSWSRADGYRLEGQPDSVNAAHQEEQMKTTQEVLSFAPSSDKPGAWLKLKVKDDKGQERDSYIKDPALAALVKQPGMYEFEKEKNGSYWDIVGVKYLRPAGAPATTGGGQTASGSYRNPNVADVNVIIQNRAITAQVAIKAAVELVGKALEAGAYKSPDKAVVDTSAAYGDASNLVAQLLGEAAEFVKGKSEEKPGTRTEGGLTYEKTDQAEGA